MNPEIKVLIENLEFHENKDKPGLYSRKLEENDACGKAGVTAHVDFRRATDKGRRFYTIDGIDGFFDQDEDVNTIPILAYFKEQRDNILKGVKQSLSSSIEHSEKQPPQKSPARATPAASSRDAETTEKDKLKLGTPDTISMVSPVATIDQAVEIFKLYEEAKSKILNDNDILWIGEDGKPAIVGKGHPHIKRSGWRKLARFFGLSCRILSSNKIMNGDGKNYQWTYHVIAMHPSGASQEAIGVASSKDKFFTKGGKVEAKEENVILKAQTVGFNRAIADLLGCGEISAEEMG